MISLWKSYVQILINLIIYARIICEAADTHTIIKWVCSTEEFYSTIHLLFYASLQLFILRNIAG